MSHLWAYFYLCNIIFIYHEEGMIQSNTNSPWIEASWKHTWHLFKLLISPYGIYKNGTVYWSWYSNLQHPVKKLITFVYVFCQFQSLSQTIFCPYSICKTSSFKVMATTKINLLVCVFYYPCYWVRHFFHYSIIFVSRAINI